MRLHAAVRFNMAASVCSHHWQDVFPFFSPLFFFLNARQKVHLRTTLFRVVRNGRPRQRVIGRKRGELRAGKTQEQEHTHCEHDRFRGGEKEHSPFLAPALHHIYMGKRCICVSSRTQIGGRKWKRERRRGMSRRNKLHRQRERGQ